MKTEDLEKLSSSNGENGKIKVKLHPLTLDLKDVVWILTAVVSIVVAWGLYGSRITVLEVNQVTTNTQVKELRSDLEKQKDVNISQDKQLLELQLKNHIPRHQ